jgi:putative FmdB family regulatory protein
MPTYEYLCESCGHRFEVFHSASERLVQCRKCKKRKLVRLVGGGAGIIFKGSGFYETDYKKKSGGSDGKHRGTAN